VDIDPMEHVETDENDEERTDERKAEKRKSGLNAWVAIAVALMATFLGICNVKDGNIGQSMQQAQSDRVDAWAYYQARNIRVEVAAATADQLTLQLASAPAALKPRYAAKIKYYQDEAKHQNTEKDKQKATAEQAEKDYDRLNYHDDQFDLCESLGSIAISLFALTSLTQKRWLFFIALVPTFFAMLMGLSGLLGWHIHSDLIAKWLS